ncbi:MAG: hypothetical protein AAB784_00145 [Patescibacteria group bacterium]
MFISTLPPIHMEGLMEEMIAHSLVDGVRYNIGGYSAYKPKETLERILGLTEEYKKKFWLDLKGRQLRISRWTMGSLGKATLNHKIQVDTPARVYFRGNDWSEIKVVNGDTIFVDPLPKNAVGEGQAINIHGDNLKIFGYLTDDDREYIDAAAKLGMHSFMLSFVEGLEDAEEFEQALGYGYRGMGVDEVFKIESPKGMEFVRQLGSSGIPSELYTLMAARDDWFTNTIPRPQILKDLEDMVKIDPKAIVASHIFGGLEGAGMVTMADLSDLYLMRHFGYKNFMLSDGISKRHFKKAVEAWEEFLDYFPMEERNE